MMNHRVLFIAHDSTLYGGNQSLINMISALQSTAVYTLTVFPYRGPICNLFDELGFAYLIIKYRTECAGPNVSLKNKIYNSLRFLYKTECNYLALFKLKKVVSDYNINIIHSNSSVVSIGSHLAESLNIKHVWHLREYISDYDLKVLSGFEKYKGTIQKSANIISITNGIAEYYDVSDKSFVLFDAVRKNIKNFQENSKGEEKYFLFCGSLNENKGIKEALFAFNKFSKSHEGYYLYVAGSGSLEYEQSLMDLARKLNISESIRFLGFRIDIDNLLHNAIALLVCSKNEGLGRVTIEAMFNKCLVIGNDSTGTAELITDKKNGLLFEDFDRLKEVMSNVVKGTYLLDNIREEAFSFALANFTEAVFAEKLMLIYNKLN